MGEMVVQLFDYLGSYSYKPTKKLKKEKLRVTTHIENKQGSYTHKPTK
jgi:hypothetical protein